jgi:hypothetical protein
MEDRKAVMEMWDSVWSAAYTGRRIAIAQEVFNKYVDYSILLFDF